MATIVKEIVSRALLAMIFTSGCISVFKSLLIFGENRFQTTLVFSFYVYCILALFCNSRERLFHVLSIPVLTQFLHLFQKYSFTAGANSLWRLFPFLILNFFFIDFLIRSKVSCPPAEKLLLASWIVLNFFFLAITPGLAAILYGSSVLILITVPLYFRYLSIIWKEPGFSDNVEKSLFVIYLILGFGTFGLVAAGASYKGSDNLLATRNISDTNVTMAYFILLWPFVLLFARKTTWSLSITLASCLIFVSIVMISFSRGAVVIVGPLMISTLFCTWNRVYLISFALIAALFAIYGPELIDFANSDLAYFWNLRIGDLHSVGSLGRKLQDASGRSEIHAVAYSLFLRNPLFGHGTGSFEVLGPGYREAHSMLYTFLAEQGLLGTIYIYSIFIALAHSLFKTILLASRFAVLLLALIAYLVFVHSVGTVFFIIPAKSITVNCVAPVLLICTYFYALSIARIEKGSVNA
ncbi:O-antigen ligase family protein [Dyadobacter sp. MSC1_007]|jgi:O-antigen ligase|uniref:O-antigen ligase family protein n=1 Tax=Dyadobacter sp. MSC1_007 TaxID=2909264 RepID=UPI00202EC6B4|nr:O-antigen ligase family protein [Dyadobacter sp. MSC1_007]